MKNVEIDIDEKDSYIDWLENTCLTFLTNNKMVSKESVLKKLKGKGIDTENCFVTHLLEIYSNKLEENRIIQKLPLLRSYPICLNDDVYDEDIEPVYKWELETIKSLLLKLNKQYNGENITPEVYYDFFIKEIKHYKEYFLNDIDMDGMIFEKILPENISLYWSYRVNDNISWDKSWEQKCVCISIISIIEGNYLDKDKRMEEFRHIIG